MIGINQPIAELTVTIRREREIRLPHAVIRAKAQHHHALLVRRNTKDFPKTLPGIRVPYKV